jgi:hypothetical protein
MSVVTVEEAAKYPFVSRAHIHKLLAAGKLVERLQGGPPGQPDIDVASVETYRTEMEAAQRAYLDSQTEDNAPSGFDSRSRLPAPHCATSFGRRTARRGVCVAKMFASDLSLDDTLGRVEKGLKEMARSFMPLPR